MVSSFNDDNQSKVSTATTFDKIKSTKKRSSTRKRKSTKKTGISAKKKNLINEEEETKSSMFEASQNPDM